MYLSIYLSLSICIYIYIYVYVCLCVNILRDTIRIVVWHANVVHSRYEIEYTVYVHELVYHVIYGPHRETPPPELRFNEINKFTLQIE